MLVWGICSGGRIFLKSLRKTLIFCLFLRVLTKPLAHRLQTRKMKESVCWPGLPFATGCFSLLFMDLAFSARSHQIETYSEVGLFSPVRPMGREASCGDTAPDVNVQPEGEREGGWPSTALMPTGAPMLPHRPLWGSPLPGTPLHLLPGCEK